MAVSTTDDGAVHVWRDYCSDSSEGQSPTLVTAWRALVDMLPASRSESCDRHMMFM